MFAIKDFTEYLKRNQIPYVSSSDAGIRQITMTYPVENAPGGYVEGCIWWYGDGAEVRVYYDSMGADICKKSEHKDGLLRLLNFINARVFLCCGDASGLYAPHMLYTPRIYLTEDDCGDITITTMINYDFWKVTPVETADYITIYCPELLDRLSPAIFGVLLGQMDSEQAKGYVKEELLGE
ncbi:MAG: hypothetical protein NC517_10690 [Firmicutes bacterium]|nr:hypothetical protein [Bacillota bacterium]